MAADAADAIQALPAHGLRWYGCKQEFKPREGKSGAGDPGSLGSLMPLFKTAVHRHRQCQPAARRELVEPVAQTLRRIMQPVQNKA